MVGERKELYVGLDLTALPEAVRQGYVAVGVEAEAEGHDEVRGFGWRVVAWGNTLEHTHGCVGRALARESVGWGRGVCMWHLEGTRTGRRELCECASLRRLTAIWSGPRCPRSLAMLLTT